MSDELTLSLERAWRLVVGLILAIDRGLGVMAPRTLLHMTRLAESLVRRWLVLNACATQANKDSVWPKVRAARRPQAPQDTPPNPYQEPPWTPKFRLFESQQAGFEVFDTPIPETAAQSSPIPPQSPQLNPENLARRLRALKSVVRAPEAETRRMARWLARAAQRRKTGPGRLHPLRVGRPPGGGRARRRKEPERQAMLYWLDTLAREAVQAMAP